MPPDFALDLRLRRPLARPGRQLVTEAPAAAGTRLPITRSELVAVAPLVAAVSLRMLGLFLLLPVLAPYVLALDGGTWQLAGYAVGAYGLTQAVMLVPLGWLSDRWGRKPVIAGGMLAFAAGGFIAGAADSPQGVIAGRALQGAGAISAAALAAVADATAPASRALGMAAVGVGIAASFGLAIMLSGPLAAAFGVNGLLHATGVLGLAGAGAICLARLPAPAAREARSKGLRLPVSLLLPCSGVLAIHVLLAGLFVFASVHLAEQLSYGRLWQVYMPAFLLAAAAAAPFIMRASSMPRLPAGSMALLAAAAPAAAAAAFGTPAAFAAALVAFFAAFCILEALLPAMASRMAPASGRGASMGVFAICQAGGAFAGAAGAGLAGAKYGIIPIAAVSALLLLWALAAIYYARNKRITA